MSAALVHFVDTLDKKLTTVIGQLTDSARASKIISVNAALLADQIHHDRTNAAAALKVVAAEIQRLSEESKGGIDALHSILGEVKMLTQTINLAGRQRMISQRVMKLYLIQRAQPSDETGKELARWRGEFVTALKRLHRCTLNTAPISRQLSQVDLAWAEFSAALAAADTGSAIRLNDRVLQEMHAAVLLYESLAGAQPVAS